MRALVYQVTVEGDRLDDETIIDWMHDQWALEPQSFAKRFGYILDNTTPVSFYVEAIYGTLDAPDDRYRGFSYRWDDRTFCRRDSDTKPCRYRVYADLDAYDATMVTLACS
ncbi:MAG: hypothetical protein EOO77_22000 [Oxalobacteraceae bacterium]|nr:MAG: hypothetical protein EOO77_22000 [Oxalobacteraceae bacterium]